jgi:ribosomal-protein-alanine N-acetyltransferase
VRRHITCAAHHRLGRELTPHVSIHLRWLVPRDLPRILAIEIRSFAFPWSEKDFRDFLRDAKCVCIVAEQEERIVGFTAFRLGESCIRICNLAVVPSYRRCGVATRMLRTLIDLPSWQSRKSINVLVRETNLAAQVFFRAQGFRAVSILRNFVCFRRVCMN